MTKAELISAMAGVAGISKAAAAKALQAYTDSVTTGNWVWSDLAPFLW
jgi:nucleoid DNA-binding protein